MNLSEIREECWSIARDTALEDDDRLWPTSEMNLYINRVYNQIARETLCLRDSTTPAVCLITTPVVDYTTYDSGTLDYIWANDSSSALYQKNICHYLYSLNTSILKIHEVKWVSGRWPLTEVSVQKWQLFQKWEQIIGTPTEYATDLEAGKLALNFRSEEANTLQLQVSRMPLESLSSDTDVPEIKLAYHDLMFNGIMAQMYSKEDADTINIKKADAYKLDYKKDIDSIKQLESKINERLRPNYAMGAFR